MNWEKRYREALFGEALLHKLPVTVGELGFEHVLITINVLLMCS